MKKIRKSMGWVLNTRRFKRKDTKYLSMLAFFAFLLASCSTFESKGLLGEWQGVSLSEPQDAIPVPQMVKMAFHEGFTYEMVGGVSDVSGEYHFMGNTLVLDNQGVEWPISVKGIVNDTLILNLNRVGKPNIFKLVRIKN